MTPTAAAIGVVRDLEGVLAFVEALGLDVTGELEVEGIRLQRVADPF